MRKSSKIISAFMAMVMLFSCMSIGVDAAYSAYKDSAITSYDPICEPILTTAQYSSMALDEIDRMLGEANIYESFDLGIMQITLDATSVDAALQSVCDIWDTAKGLKTVIGGDVASLNMSALYDTQIRRTTAGKYDYDILYSLLTFLSDNRGIIAKAANHTLDLGMINNFIDFDLDLQQMIKGILFGVAYPDEEAPEPITLTVDEMVQDIIHNLLVGEIDPETNELDGLLPELEPLFVSGGFNINTTSFYSMIENAAVIIWNNTGVELINTKVKKFVRELCGVVYADEDDLVGDASHVNSYANLLNINFTVPTISLDAGETIVTEFNDILGSIIEAVANMEYLNINWQYGTSTVEGNTYLLSNIVAVGKKIVKLTGNAFFADYVDVATDAQIDAMTDMQFVSFIVRSIVNGSVSSIDVPASCDTLREIAVYCASTVISDYIPENYATYKSYRDGAGSTAALQEMAADVIVYFANQYTDADLYYEDDFNTTLSYLVDWAASEYGGLIGMTIPDATASNVWGIISDIVFSIIPSNWLPLNSDGTAKDDAYELIFTDVIDNILDLDLEGLISLFEENTSANAGLKQPVAKILVNLVKNIINFVLPNTATPTYTTFEDLISVEKLPTLVSNLLANLNNYKAKLMASLLPILCGALGLTAEEEFGYPYISLPETITGATSFYIYNSSSGLNTAYRNLGGTLTRDQLYKYRINSITTNQTGVTIKYNGAAISSLFINGGVSSTFTMSGTPTNNSLLTLTVNYDVYDEYGTKMTSTALTETVYSYVTTSKDDSDTDKNVNVIDANTHSGTYVATTYINQNGSLNKLNDYSITLKRKIDANNTHTTAATISLASPNIASGFAGSGVTANTFTNISTTYTDSYWKVIPYSVNLTETSVRPADGVYASTFTYLCTKTISSGGSESLPFTHNVCLYNDYDLPSLFNSAASSNRQESQYGTGNYTYTYVDEEGDTCNETVNGADAWDNYMDAMDNAASVVCRPKNVNLFYDTVYVNSYKNCADDLKDCIARLEACAVSSGVTPLATLLETYDPSNEKVATDPETGETIIDPETGEVVMTDKDYYETGYVFIDRVDYLGYTYNRFTDERRAARDVVNDQKSDNPSDISALKLAYVEHRLSLYGSRLIRVRSYVNALNDEITKVTAAGYVQADYTTESWENYQNALTFAQATYAKRNEGTYNASGYLTSADGLRQSQVNVAKAELVEAVKKLVTSADYTALNAQLDRAAGYTNSALYTSPTWAAFSAALTAAQAIDPELVNTEDNQALIDAAAAALENAIDGLVLAADYTQLDAAIASALAYRPNNGVYTEDSYATFDAAYDAAVAIARDLPSTSQSTINAACEALQNAIAGLEYGELPGITPAPDTTTVVDDTNISCDEYSCGFFYGLNNFFPEVSGTVDATGGATVEIVANEFGLESTGAFVNVYSNGVLSKQYQVIWFGDINGDATVDGSDFTLVDSMMQGVGDLADLSGGYIFYNAYTMACDTNGDFAIDGTDYTMVDCFAQGMYAINQMHNDWENCIIPLS